MKYLSFALAIIIVYLSLTIVSLIRDNEVDGDNMNVVREYKKQKNDSFGYKEGLYYYYDVATNSDIWIYIDGDGRAAISTQQRDIKKR